MEIKDIHRQYLLMKAEMDAAIMGCVQGSQFIGGASVKKFEEEFSNYLNVKHVVPCANGSDALVIALMALGVKKGDAIFVPDFSFIASANSILWVGATPIFVDVNQKSFNMDCDSLANAINVVKQNSKLTPKAIITVDLFGQACDYDTINKIAKENNFYVIEDAAQSIGGTYKGKKNGSFGDISTTSFFPVKPLGCYGDGGAICTNDDKLFEKIKSICMHGAANGNKYDNDELGMNSRLDTLQSAILSIKLKHLDNETVAINNIAKQYNELLKGFVETPSVDIHCMSAWAQYTIKCKSKKERDKLQAYLLSKKVKSMVYYFKPLHQQKVFGSIEKINICKNSIDLSEIVLSIPIFPYLTKQEVDEIAQHITSFMVSI